MLDRLLLTRQTTTHSHPFFINFLEPSRTPFSRSIDEKSNRCTKSLFKPSPLHDCVPTLRSPQQSKDPTISQIYHYQKDAIVIDKTDDTDDKSSDLDFVRIRSRPKTVFRQPPFSQTFQQHKKTTSLSRSSEVGTSQGVGPPPPNSSVLLTSTRDFFCRISDDPLMMEDDDEKTGETGASTRTTSVKSEIGTVNFQSSHRTRTHTHTHTHIYSFLLG